MSPLLKTIGLLTISNAFMTIAWYGLYLGEKLAWNYYAAFGCILVAVFFVFYFRGAASVPPPLKGNP